MRAATTFLILWPGVAYAQASEIAALVGSAEKMGVVAVLVVGLYVAWKEILRGRGHLHSMRNQVINCHLAREMWKTAFFSRGAQPDEPDVKLMIEREERLLKPTEAGI